MINILVVDDDIAIQKLVGHYLRKAGYSVMVASSAEEALAKKFSVLPDLIILDRIMDGLDGLELVHKLKSKKPASYIRVIMLTSCSGESDIEKGLNMGADDYVVKPFEPQLLLARVKAQLRVKVIIDHLLNDVVSLRSRLSMPAQYSLDAKESGMASSFESSEKDTGDDSNVSRDSYKKNTEITENESIKLFDKLQTAGADSQARQNRWARWRFWRRVKKYLAIFFICLLAYIIVRYLLSGLLHFIYFVVYDH